MKNRFPIYDINLKAYMCDLNKGKLIDDNYVIYYGGKLIGESKTKELLLRKIESQNILVKDCLLTRVGSKIIVKKESTKMIKHCGTRQPKINPDFIMKNLL